MPIPPKQLKVFLCHSSQDKPAVRELYKKLNAEGWIDPWLDEMKLLPGQDWDYEIKKALDSSDAVIIILSTGSVSKEGYVQKELRFVLELALEKPEGTIFILPIRLNDCERPRGLRYIHSVDYFPPENCERAYESLRRSLELRANTLNIFTIAVRSKHEVHSTTSLQDIPQTVKKPVHDIGKIKYEIKEITSFENQINWQMPDIENILEKDQKFEVNEQYIQDQARLIQETLASFSAPVQVVEINRNASITQFGVEPLFTETRSGRVKVRTSKIESLAHNLAVVLGKRNIRVLVPVPGHKFVGIEVPNDKFIPMRLRDIIKKEPFVSNMSPLKFVIGRDVMRHTFIGALDDMSPLLIAGTSHSGKSVFVNSLLASLLLFNTPSDLRLILIDPLQVELGIYNGIPHLAVPVIIEVERAISTLHWITVEMDKRYKLFAKNGVRNIIDYNTRINVSNDKKLPFLVVVISEYAQLIKNSSRETEQFLTRLARLARPTGIHLILVTQHLSVDVLTRSFKANFPTRLVFAVASSSESRTILDQNGAELLLGRGDMLYQASSATTLARVQAPFISNDEIQNLLEFWSSQVQQAVAIAEMTNPGNSAETKTEPLISEAIELVRREGRASVSMLQRHMRIGYTRAARIVDLLEDNGIVGPPEGTSRIRKILDSGPDSSQKDF
jgi:DNA segregation ATPase FtsK/SpoIIIE-like protein